MAGTVRVRQQQRLHLHLPILHKLHLNMLSPMGADLPLLHPAADHRHRHQQQYLTVCLVFGDIQDVIGIWEFWQHGVVTADIVIQ